MPRLSFVQRERGIVLPIAIGTLLLLAVVLVSVVSFTSTNQRSSKLSNARQVAVAVAEAGLNHAQSVLVNAADPATAGALPASCGVSPIVSAEGGTACYWGSLDAGVTPHEWTVGATSTVPNPAGGSSLTHTITSRFRINTTPPIVGNEAWNFVFSNSAGCTTIENHVVVGAPFYTVGDLCLKNHAQASGPKVFVRGGLTVDDHATVGASPSDASDPALATGQGCRYTTSPPHSHSTCGAAQQVYTSSYSSTVPVYAKPPVDLAYWRLNAKPGPSQPCTTSSGSVPSFTTTGAVELMPSSSYTCQVWQGGTLVGELSWNNAAKVLTVSGVVYFDGELALQNDQTATYDGKATVYFAKKGIFKNHAELCAVTGCAATGWDPNARLLTLVVGAADVPAFELDNHAKFQGAVYVVGGFKVQNHALMHGPVIAESVEAVNHGLPSDWPELTSLNPGMPAAGGTPTVTFIPGSWRG